MEPLYNYRLQINYIYNNLLMLGLGLLPAHAGGECYLKLTKIYAAMS